MVSKISAEFDSLDSAEAAARAVKHSIDGVTKISISGRQQFAVSDYGYRNGRAGGGTIGATGMFFPQSMFNLVNESSYFLDGTNTSVSIEQGREAFVEIYCDSQVQDSVSRILVGLGGLRVKKAQG